MNMRAIDRLEPFQRAISKAHLAAAGICIESLNTKPLIAVANSWNEVCPGHASLRALADDVKKGIIEAGGEPIEFNTIALCDGIAQGHSGMRYCLPHRDLIADSIEAMVFGEAVFDGIVFLGSCDKIIPGMLNAAARINLPSIFVTAGPCYNEILPSDSKEARQQFLRGEISEDELIERTLHYYTGAGVCPFLGTANTMACLCEALGMMLPGGSLLPYGTSLRRFHARASGRQIMELVDKQILPRDIMTNQALANATVLLSAIGGSLNALLHLPALAAELGLTLCWEDIAKITGSTPVITAITPNGNRTVIDLYKAGGIPAVLRELRPLLACDAVTVTGETVDRNLQNSKSRVGDVIRTMEDPISAADGIQILRGNIAPEGALVKTSAVPESMHVYRGMARVFHSEDDCYKAFSAGEIHSGDVLVISYEGPKGGPGMREMHRTTEIIKGIPNTAIITDGRLSGASGGLSVGYVCPEAACGGSIGLIRDGDVIDVDLDRGILNAVLSEEEMQRRRQEWKPVQHPTTHYLKRYADSVQPANLGAVQR